MPLGNKFDDARDSSVSAFISDRTRVIKAGKVVQSPERRSARAWFWIRVGQFWGEALRAWRRVSWILWLKMLGCVD